MLCNANPGLFFIRAAEGKVCIRTFHGKAQRLSTYNCRHASSAHELAQCVKRARNLYLLGQMLGVHDDEDDDDDDDHHQYYGILELAECLICLGHRL